jgi:hypothetical protein
MRHIGHAASIDLEGNVIAGSLWRRAQTLVARGQPACAGCYLLVEATALRWMDDRR